MQPTPLDHTHTHLAALDRGTQLLLDLAPVCPEAAWIGGHLVRAIAALEDIPNYVDFDIAVPLSKLSAIEEHIRGLGWVIESADVFSPDVDRTPLPHRRWKTGPPLWQHVEKSGVHWPRRVAVDLVIYDDTQGETLPGLVARFDLNVLHLWAVLDTALPKEPPKMPEERWVVTQGAFDYAREHLPEGWGTLHAIHDALYLADPGVPWGRESWRESAYEAIQTGDVRLVSGAWFRPWRLGKYRLALGLGPLTGETLPICRPPGVKRDALPPAGFMWVEYRDVQSWRNRGPCRAPWVLGDLNAYTDAQKLHDTALRRGVAVSDYSDPAQSWTTWDHETGEQREGVIPLTLRNCYVIDIHPGNPDAPQPGQYVREWSGEIHQTDPANNLLVRATQFPEDVFERILTLHNADMNRTDLTGGP